MDLKWGRSSAGRASRSQCEGREFDPPRLHHFLFHNVEDYGGGSNVAESVKRRIVKFGFDLVSYRINQKYF